MLLPCFLPSIKNKGKGKKSPGQLSLPWDKQNDGCKMPVITDKMKKYRTFINISTLPMSKPVSFQTVIEYVEALSTEEQDLLLELISKRRIEQRRQEIARNAAQTLEAIRTGTAKHGNLEDLRADLFSEE
jgi:hypothetical protein